MSPARRTFCVSIAIVPLLASVSRAQVGDLQYARNPANGHWYGFTSAPTSWPEGASAAAAAGGYLASITTSAEQTWVQGAFGPYSTWKYWIGLNDIATEGQFVWANGEPFSYANWNSGQPDNAGGVDDAVELQPGSSWRWNDANPATATTTKPLVEVDGLPRAGWTLPNNVSVGSGPSYVARGDFNGDGRDDLVVPNFTSNTVTLLFGQASGTLGAAATFPVPSGPRSAAVGDFDADGKLDWAVSCYSAQQVSVRYGDGLGGFAAPLDISSSGKGHGLAALDLDLDGRVDLALTTVDSLDRLLIFRALAGRTFAAPVAYATGARPYFVTAGDLEGDGDVDLVVANEASDDIGVYWNQGSGTFLSTALVARGDSPRRIALLDIDRDGLLDMAVPCANQNLVRILYAAGAGNFVTGPAIAGGQAPNWTAAVDTNGDGMQDLVTAAFGSEEVLIQEILADGTIVSQATALVAGSNLSSVVGLDLNGDGRADLVAAGNNTSRVVAFTKLSRDCNTNGRDDDLDIVLAGSTDCNGNLEPDECDLALGTTFDCDANGLLDACEILANPTLDLDVDGRLDACEVAGTPFCFGDGTGAACPCDPGQAGALGAGCMNSVGNSGRLVAVGNPSVANDSVSLRASGLLPTAVGLFFQGNLQQNGGLGAAFGDGLLCVTQFVIRLEIRAAIGGAMAFGRDHPGDPRLSVDGSVPVSGATRHYQVWYRDAANYCTQSTYNLTNGVRVVWAP
ncbi:MAG: FG-GAP-like repeat-containing protein [Planctomycetota bacterium]|nr:FG-GAP-like repeat-containing protein [Planctomycetota bacterium]